MIQQICNVPICTLCTIRYQCTNMIFINNPKSYLHHPLSTRHVQSNSQSSLFSSSSIFPIHSLLFVSITTISNQDCTNSLLTGLFIQYPLLLTAKPFSTLQLEIYLWYVNLNIPPHSVPKIQDKRQYFNLLLQGRVHFAPSHFSSLIWIFISHYHYALATLVFFHVPLCHVSFAHAVPLLRMLFPITSLLLVNADSSFCTQQNHPLLREDFPELLLYVYSPVTCKYDGSLSHYFAAFITVIILHLFDGFF